MNDLQIKAVLAGVLFGIWPLIMNKSGLSGNLSSGAFALGAFLVVSPFAFRELGTAQVGVTWSMVVIAAIFGGLGLLSFTSMLSNATYINIGALIVLMTVVQIAIPALYHVVMNGQLTLSKMAGFVLAIAAAVLLTRN